MLPLSCTPARLAGLLVYPAMDGRLPALLVRARSADGGAALAETFSAPDGQFALTLPLAGPAGSDFRLAVRVEVLDGGGSMLCEGSLPVAPGEQVALTLTMPVSGEVVPAYEPATLPPLVDTEAAALLREHVRSFVARGELPEATVPALEEALRPLEWATALLPEAQAALRGDPQAGARLRSALLSWSGPTPEDEPLELLTEEDGEAPDTSQTGLVDAGGLLPIALAAVHVSANPREAQMLLDGLAAAVWSRPWVDLLYVAARQGNPAPLRTMMGGVPGAIPGLPGGGRPVGGLPGGGIPGGGFPGGPGWGNVPGKKSKNPGIHVSPTIADLMPYFRNPVNLPPSAQERCLVGALAEVAIIKQALPHYTIRAFDNPNACAGQPLTMTGDHFGKSGLVVFPGVAQPVAAELWTDTTIRVTVPNGTAPGKIYLSIFEQRLQRCGKAFDIYRLGDTLLDFSGGVPKILSLWVDSVQGDTSAEPGSDVNIWFETSQGSRVTAVLTITNGGVVIFQTPPLPGGGHSLTFHAPAAPSGPIDLTVTLRAQGVCEAVERAVTLTITHQPHLRIQQMEVTQGIQRLDSSVRVAAHRRTLARLYLDNGLCSFSYTANPRELPGVTGSITLWRGSQKLAVVSPTPAVITSRFFFQPGGREDLSITLNFWLPVEHLSGPLRLEARVWLAAPPHGVIDGPHTHAVRFLDLNFETTNHVRIVRVLLQDDSRGLMAPPASAFFIALAGARARLPLPDDGYEIYLPPGSPVLATNHDLTTVEGWESVVDDLDDLAEDTANAWNYAWAGMIAAQMPGAPALALNGIGTAGNSDENHPAMVCQVGLPTTFAHELVHVFGVTHAGCPPSGPDMPAAIDPSLPQYIEDYAYDLTALPPQIFYPGFTGAGELMSYCGESNRWTSIVLWHRLMDILKV
jgi:hypothetical protein